MSTEVSTEEGMELAVQATKTVDDRTVAEQLQRVYEHVLNDKRPEAVGATEQLAEQLDIEIKRPNRFPTRASR